MLVGYFAWPLRTYEFFFLVLSYILILAFELMNTAFERAFERLHPERHELIGRSKDLASAAVLLAILFAAIVALAILSSRYFA